MKILAMALAVLGSAASALAAPGDPTALRGTLAWPPTLESSAPFAAIQSDDGRLYYADLSSVQRRSPVLRAGGRVSVIGLEGNRPHEITAVAVGAGDTALAAPPVTAQADPSAQPPATPVPSAQPPATPAPATVPAPPPQEQVREAPPLQRIDGYVDSLSGRTLVVRTAGSRRVSVDLSRVSPALLAILKPGEPITVLGVVEPDQRLMAVGFIHADPAPSALPRESLGQERMPARPNTGR